MTLDIQAWLPTILGWVIRATLALLLLWVGGRYARRVRNGVTKLLKNPRIPLSMSRSLTRLASETAFIAFWVLVIGAALVLIGVPLQWVIISIVALLAVGAYALRESLANLAATVVFVLFQPFRLGEYIETGDYSGTVYDMELFNTVLMTPQQFLVTLPNAKIQSEGIINYSRIETARVDLDFWIPYSQDIEVVRKIIIETIALDTRVLPDPAPWVVTSEVTVVAVHVVGYGIITQSERILVSSDLRAAIMEAFSRNGIAAPKPAMGTIAADEDA